MSYIHKKWLHKSIEKILIPELQENGFEWIKQKSSKEVGREIFLGWPFGVMRRNIDGFIDIVEITIEKRDRSQFFLTAGRFHEGGVRDYLYGNHVAPNDVRTSDLEEYWTLIRCPKCFNYLPFSSGFRVPFKFIRRVKQSHYENLVRRVSGYIPEIEEALDSGKIGPHMMHVKMDRVYEQPKALAR